MASTASPEASEIRRRGRRRLIGAIALVMLLVVFVPMVLDSEPRPARNEPNATIPPRDSAPPLPAPPPAAAPATSVAPAPDKGARGQAPAGAQSEAPKAAVVTPATPVAPAKAGAQSADAPKLQGFAVQVGAFRDEDKLKLSREKLAAAGVVHYTERLESKAGPLTRLRAGPFATREQAEAALVKLRRSTIDGKVVPLP